MASHLVLLGSPRELHIPYFAMAVPRSRESYVERLSIAGDLVGLVGRRCASWIKSRQENIELIATRNYLFPRTAIYTKWLLFKDESTAAEFLNSYPKYRLEHRLKTIGSERRALAIKLQERLRRGDFDLGRVGDEQQRENLARRYLETADTLRVLSSQLSLVDMARQLAERWQNELCPWVELTRLTRTLEAFSRVGGWQPSRPSHRDKGAGHRHQAWAADRGTLLGLRGCLRLCGKSSFEM